jgi:hypothetical protein
MASEKNSAGNRIPDSRRFPMWSQRLSVPPDALASRSGLFPSMKKFSPLGLQLFPRGAKSSPFSSVACAPSFSGDLH